MIENVIEYNALVMNDATKKDLTVAPNYYIHVDQVDGLFGGADVTYETYPLSGVDGEHSGDVKKNGRSLVLSGSIVALGFAYMRVGMRALEAAFWDNEKHFLRYQLLGEPRLKIECRVNQEFTSVEVQSNLIVKRLWTVGLRADSPRSLHDTLGTVYPAYMSS